MIHEHVTGPQKLIVQLYERLGFNPVFQKNWKHYGTLHPEEVELFENGKVELELTPSGEAVEAVGRKWRPVNEKKLRRILFQSMTR
jgi:hypothetical protein